MATHLLHLNRLQFHDACFSSFACICSTSCLDTCLVAFSSSLVFKGEEVSTVADSAFLDLGLLDLTFGTGENPRMISATCSLLVELSGLVACDEAPRGSANSFSNKQS